MIAVKVSKHSRVQVEPHCKGQFPETNKEVISIRKGVDLHNIWCLGPQERCDTAFYRIGCPFLKLL